MSVLRSYHADVQRQTKSPKCVCFSCVKKLSIHQNHFDTNVKMFQAERDDSPPRAVDLVRLEKVLDEAPPGLQIPEAVRAKKMAAR